MSYVPNTDLDRAKMLDSIGVDSVQELFSVIPEAKRFPDLDLPQALSEMELLTLLEEMSWKNANLEEHVSFLGAGSYRHFIPKVVDTILRRGEFLTAYTPYQPEVSQGTLTVIYEYQTLICQLTAMEVANASMYDGASALAEAALMAARVTHRDKLVLSAAVHPEYRETVRTYVQGIGLEIATTAYNRRNGLTKLGQLAEQVDDETACVAVQYPNFFGSLEDLGAAAEIAHQYGAKFVVVANPIALGLLKPPGEYGADIVVGEGQPMAIAPSFGGPYLGFFACRMKDVRQMPGRLAGMTTDTDGRRGFVLTLAPREQHIRREKATSNICTNEALVALAATVYLALMGKNGLREVSELCYHKAHYTAQEIDALNDYELAFGTPFFNEFAVRCPRPVAEINEELMDRGIVGGYDVSRAYPELDHVSLFCVTEMNSRAQIDRLVHVLEEIA